ncbi:MAG: hypothetical protein GWN01_09910 [Nitrosopumilaceae archaeon]|nr:hypothetical protein [Nitrosopumilaceae archaeon]NIU87574.1 hypothetical protein [Nitrosopumilaceae archaeon]NIX61822.1 hypothetical protein [Nitrosopumilaceae archaeon]
MKNAEQLKEEKKKLEDGIKVLVDEFLNRNGDCDISIDVDLNRFTRIDRNSKIVGSEINIRLRI